MDEVKRYAIFVGHTFKDGVMDVMDLVQYGSSWPVKVYFLILHVLLLSLVFYMFLYSKKGKYSKNLHKKGTRTFKRGNRAVTSESCQWINSLIAWFYLHSGAKSAPDLVKMWIRNMNRALYQKRTSNQRIFITNICPNCLPPKLTSVYCLTVDGTMKCFTFHVESSDLGFHVHVSQPTTNGRSKNVILEVNVRKLSGEVALQLNNSPFEVKISFIGDPEIQFSTRAITKDGLDAETVDAVEEKLKEVICKTVTTVPLTDNTKDDTETQNNGSLKDKLDSPILQTCVGEEGKLLVKVIKATGLCSKDQSAKISPYCIITTDQPYQRKRTSLMKETESPFWNEYFAFDITSKTREITLNIFDFEKTPSDANYHMDDNELSAEKDDFLGQAIVPLATVNRNQTCRLILPILPKTNKCDYVKGELSLEFTFDKDGKVIDGALPLVDITDSSAKPTAVEHTVYDVTIDKTQAVPAVNDDLPEKRSFGGAYAYSLDKSYMETSLDELAQEIEAYEAGTGRASASEEKSVEIVMKPKETDQREHDDTELMLEVAALDATLGEPSVRKTSPVITPTQSTEKAEDKEDNKPPVDEQEQQLEPIEEPKEETVEESKEECKEEAKEEQKEEHKEEPKESKHKTKKSLFKRRPKSTVDEDKKTDKDADTSRHSYHAGDKPIDEAPENENEPKPDAEELGTELKREPKSKMRRSFNMKFKRGKKDKDKESSSSTQEIDAPKSEPHDEKKEQEAVEESLKSDPPKSRFKSRFRRDKDKEPSSTTQDTDTPKEEPLEEKKEEAAAEEGAKTDAPKSRFKSRFKKDKEKDSTAQETEAPKEEEQEAEQSLKSGPSKSRFSGRFKRKKHQDKQEDEKKDETKEEGKEKDEKKDEEPKQEELKEEVAKPIEVELIQEEPKLGELFKEEPKQEEPKQEPEQEEPKKDEPKEEPIKEESIETKQEETKEKEPEKKELETVDENAESSPSEKPAEEPKSRFRRLNLKRGNKRPVSMSAADIKPAESIEEEAKLDPVTHSFHAGDLPETSQLRKSTSQTSLLSYSPNPFSSLVIEVKDKGEKKYYHIPVSMAKRGTYEQKGDKYHVYNDHMFKAVHFDESTNCAVCGNSISGKFGKQGYQCKGCKLATHKKCHFQTSDMCSENAAKKIDIKSAPTIVGN